LYKITNEKEAQSSGIVSPDTLVHGDCLEVMKYIPTGSVDLVLTDPPYGTTACKWDSIIPLEPMWEQLKRIMKPNGAIVVTASQPFTTMLISSNMKMFKYCWVWEKSKGLNFVQAKNMPIKFHEDIVVFSEGKTTHKAQCTKRMAYNPQGLIRVDKKWSRPKRYENGHNFSRDSHLLERVIEYGNYPRSIIKISNSKHQERGLHPTQKPVALMEYLVKTYTNEGEIVVDFAIGSCTTGVACINTKRRFIGIELNSKYFNIAKKRIEEHLKSKGET